MQKRPQKDRPRKARPANRSELEATVRPLLAERGWNASTLATEAGMPAAVLSRILTGQRQPNIDHLQSLARALEMPVIELARRANLLHLLHESVPRDIFDRVAQECAELQRALHQARAELAARQAECSALQAALSERESLMAEMRERSELAEQLRERVVVLDMIAQELRVKHQELEARLAAEAARSNELAEAWNEQLVRANEYSRKLLRAQINARALQQQALEAKTDAARASLVSAFVGVGATAFLLGHAFSGSASDEETT